MCDKPKIQKFYLEMENRAISQSLNYHSINQSDVNRKDLIAFRNYLDDQLKKECQKLMSQYNLTLSDLQNIIDDVIWSGGSTI